MIMLKINWYSEIVVCIQDAQKFHFSMLCEKDFSGTSYKWNRLSDVLLVFHSAFILHLCKYEVPHVLGSSALNFQIPSQMTVNTWKQTWQESSMSGIILQDPLFKVMAWSQTLPPPVLGKIIFTFWSYFKSFTDWKQTQIPIFMTTRMPVSIPKHQGHYCHELDVIMITAGLFIPWISQIYSALHEHHRGGFYPQKPM